MRSLVTVQCADACEEFAALWARVAFPARVLSNMHREVVLRSKHFVAIAAAELALVTMGQLMRG